jgi:superfamily I DNA/RNA helicase/RecB family exonuclease
MESTQPYRLVRHPAATGARLQLDDAQQQVVRHTGGPLLVLAGPGTGKTATIVETVAHRIEARQVDPARVLVLTFSRKAAGELRERIAGRLRRTIREPLAFTFHSYAYALVRREFLLMGEELPRLLSGPEQLLEVRRLLRGEISDGGAYWPAALRPALATRGFAEELRDFLLRAAERGLDGRRVAALGRQRRREDWVSAGRFLDRYAARFDLAPVAAYDYAEIVRIAASLLSRASIRQREREAYDVVLVDEYQDSDPAQESLLQALAGDGRELIAVGDPDQSIYAFRGADVRAITEFPVRFRAPDGSPAPVVALGTSRRSGPVLLAASRRVAQRLSAAPSAAGPGSAASHRHLTPRPDAEPGAVRIVVAESASQEAALIADTLRRAHLADGVSWSDMAILVRSATRQVPLLRRSLTASGVPVSVAGDELPLPDEPGTRPLLTLLRCALRPATLDEQTAAELLTGPLGGTDALGLRRLRRWLRATAPTETGPSDPEAAGPSRPVLPPAEPMAGAILDPRALTLVPPQVAEPAEKLARLLTVARDTIKAGRNAEEVLWAVWEESGLAATWQAASAAGGAAGAAADRDLDAVLALFDSAARFTDTLPPGAPGLFVDSLTGQEIAGDTLAEQATRDEAVRILTAHRSKGLEWNLVVVAGVQEETWPDLRLRGSLLGVDELAEAASGAPIGAAADDAAAAALVSKLLAEERRLFYVAVTRAKRSLLVTAVGGDGSDTRPSRFLAELAGDEIETERALEPGHRWLSLAALTADLRRAVADPSRPRPVREAAAAQLARLAQAGTRGAHPSHWYALTSLSDDGPIAKPGEQVRLSPSQVEAFTRCGLRWLLESAAGAGRSDVLRHLGTVIHAAAVLAAQGADDAEIDSRIDDIWHHLDFGSVWYSVKQRELAAKMVRRFLDWHAANPRELVAVEQALKVQIGPVQITGRVDRLEKDDQDRAVVVDLKTGGSAPREEELERHPQLGVYQLAVLLGAFERFGLTDPGGAELVQVGKAGYTVRAKIQPQRALGDDNEPGWAKDLVETVAAGMAGPVFQARVNPGCRTCPVAGSCPVNDGGGQVEP